MENERNARSMRGFASMDKERQRAIASRGGRAAHEKGTAHEFNSSEASMAAKRGHERGTAHEFTRDEARIAGMLRSRGQKDDRVRAIAAIGLEIMFDRADMAKLERIAEINERHAIAVIPRRVDLRRIVRRKEVDAEFHQAGRVACAAAWTSARRTWTTAILRL